MAAGERLGPGVEPSSSKLPAACKPGASWTSFTNRVKPDNTVGFSGPAHRAKLLAGALGVGALIVLSATAIHDGMTQGITHSVQAGGRGNPTGNATAPATPPKMLLGETAGEEPTTTTLPSAASHH